MSSLSAPLPFVTLSDDGNFDVSSESIAYLQQIRGDIAVVAIAGLYRTGKSYLLNLLLGRDKECEMFDVGTTVNACTKGIWIWGQPLATQNHHSTFKHLKQDTTILFMDTEGLGSTQRSQTQDTRIFALALLLSSIFIYNSRGVIDASAIEDLSLVVNLTKYIQAKTHNDERKGHETDLRAIFPDFLWVVRDFTLQLQQDGKKVTSREYLESALRQQPPLTDEVVQKNQIRFLLSTIFPSRDCVTMVRPVNDEAQLRNLVQQPYESLRPEFREQIDLLKKKLSTVLKPKMMMSNVLNGPMLVSLTQNYVAAFNDGSSPVITSVWDRVLESQCDQALESAKELFQKAFDAAIAEKTDLVMVNQMKLARPLEDAELVQIYQEAREAANKELLRDDIMSISSTEAYSSKLSDFCLDYLQTKFTSNDAVSTTFCKELLRELCKPRTERLNDRTPIVGDGVQQLQDELEASRDYLNTIVTQYKKRALGPRCSSVLNTFLLEEMIEGTIEWSTVVKTFFRSKQAQLTTESASTRQSLRSIESKIQVANERLTQQKDAHDKTIQSITERMASEQKTLCDDIQSTEVQLERTRLEIERLRGLHEEVLTRLDAQIEEAKDERKRLEAQVRAAEVCREKKRQEAQRKMLESENNFHKEETKLLLGQQELLQKVMELERCLGEQDVAQVAELYEIEKKNNQEIFELTLQYQNLEDELKESGIRELEELKTKQREEKWTLQRAVEEKKSLVATLQKELDKKEAAVGTQKANPIWNGEECVIQ